MLMIRRGRKEDAAAICDINANVMKYQYPLCKTAEILERLIHDPGHCILVADWNGKTAGYIHLHDYDSLYFGSMKNVLCLAVRPEYRRKGIASALLTEAECWAKQTGAVGIRLDSGAERLPAHACYRKAGYSERKLHKYFRKEF